MYLERRRRRWYALHDIPADVQKALGRKRFVKSLETEDKRAAERRGVMLGIQWTSEIEKARTQSTGHVERDMEFWRRAIKDAPDEEQKELLTSALDDELDERVQRAARRAGVDPHDPEFEHLPERLAATRSFAIATGELVRLDEHLEEYLATLANEAKTVDMKRSTIAKFCAEFVYITDVHRKDVQQRWVNRRAAAGKKPATIQREMSELRGYWTYLQSLSVVADDLLPFAKPSIPRGTKSGREDERQPFKPADVVAMHKAALAKKDGHLADLIELGMWTGARIEELCALKVGKVHADYFEIEDAKTVAGWRQVPIHTKLSATIERLTRDSADGFVLSGLTPNKYGDRSNAIGKRFGHLKTAEGFGATHVFHSIRRTVATMLENAGVAEGVAADIIGHDKPTMTYGLYSGGASLETKREAIERLCYGSPG